MKQVVATVISKSEVMPGVYLIWLESPRIAAVAKPGQFVMVRCGEGDELPLPRPLSIHQRDGDRIALLFAVVGKGTEWLSQRKAGGNIDLFGPLGNGFSIQSRAKNLLLVAGGMGLAPLCFLAQQAVRETRSVTVLLGAATGPLYTECPENLLPSGIKLVAATEDGTVGYHGRVTDLIPEHVNQADQVFACGPLPMYKAMGQMPELKDKPVQISLEVGMGCGRGLCYGCTIKTKQGLKKVCQDGPVFNLDDILWDELIM